MELKIGPGSTWYNKTETNKQQTTLHTHDDDNKTNKTKTKRKKQQSTMHTPSSSSATTTVEAAAAVEGLMTVALNQKIKETIVVEIFILR